MEQPMQGERNICSTPCAPLRVLHIKDFKLYIPVANTMNSIVKEKLANQLPHVYGLYF